MGATGSNGQGPVVDHNDPQRQSYAYSQERRPRMFEGGLGGDSTVNVGQVNGHLEQSQ